jgi:hypothetical protein
MAPKAALSVAAPALASVAAPAAALSPAAAFRRSFPEACA